MYVSINLIHNCSIQIKDQVINSKPLVSQILVYKFFFAVTGAYENFVAKMLSGEVEGYKFIQPHSPHLKPG